MLLSEDTSNMMVSSYSCFLATATSTAQQNTTSSPSEDDPKADLSGLWDRAVNPGRRRLSSCFSSAVPVLHLGVIGFSWKGVCPNHGTRGLKCLRAQWEWSQVIHSLDCFEVGDSEHVSLSGSLSLALKLFPFVPNDLYSFAESLANVS